MPKMNKNSMALIEKLLNDFNKFEVGKPKEVTKNCGFFSQKSEMIVNIKPKANQDFDNSSAYRNLLNTLLSYGLINSDQKKSAIRDIEDFYFDKQFQYEQENCFFGN